MDKIWNSGNSAAELIITDIEQSDLGKDLNNYLTYFRNEHRKFEILYRYWKFDKIKLVRCRAFFPFV